MAPSLLDEVIASRDAIARRRFGRRSGSGLVIVVPSPSTVTRRGLITVAVNARSQPTTMTARALGSIVGCDPAPTDDGKVSSPTIWLG